MNIVHGKSYDASIVKDGNTVAVADFFVEDTLEDIPCICTINDLYLVVALKDEEFSEPNGITFKEEYARKVATMVYEMMRK